MGHTMSIRSKLRHRDHWLEVDVRPDEHGGSIATVRVNGPIGRLTLDSSYGLDDLEEVHRRVTDEAFSEVDRAIALVDEAIEYANDGLPEDRSDPPALGEWVDPPSDAQPGEDLWCAWVGKRLVKGRMMFRGVIERVEVGTQYRDTLDWPKVWDVQNWESVQYADRADAEFVLAGELSSRGLNYGFTRVQ